MMNSSIRVGRMDEGGVRLCMGVMCGIDDCRYNGCMRVVDRCAGIGWWMCVG